jgi:ABC-2 type transport system ATP-binding protein
MVDGRIDALGTPRELKERFGVDNMDEVFLKLARPGQ